MKTAKKGQIRKNFINSGQSGSHTSSGSESEAGTPLNSPEPDDGYEWEPTPPNVFSDHDMTFTEVEIDGGEGDGDDDAGFGR